MGSLFSNGVFLVDREAAAVLIQVLKAEIALPIVFSAFAGSNMVGLVLDLVVPAPGVLSAPDHIDFLPQDTPVFIRRPYFIVRFLALGLVVALTDPLVKTFEIQGN